MVFPGQAEEGSNCSVETMEGHLQLFFFNDSLVALCPSAQHLSVLWTR